MNPSILEKVDAARAMWRGMTIVGHRDSLNAGRMIWAIPGGMQATTFELHAIYGDMKVFNAPHESELLQYAEARQAVLDAIADSVTVGGADV